MNKTCLNSEKNTLLSLNPSKAIHLLLMVFLLLTFSFANAANIISAGSGNWNSTVANAPWPGGVVPSATDNVTIAAGHTVTVTGSTSITNLNLSNTTSKLVINSGQTLNVTGTFTNSGTTTNGVNGPGTILFTGTATFGSLTPTGVRPNIVVGNGVSTNTVTVGANTSVTDLTINTGATLSFSNRTLAINGFFNNSGTVTGTTGQVNPVGNFTNSGTFTISSTGQVNVPTGNFSNTGSFSYTGAGFLKLGGNFTYSGTFSLGSAAVQFTGTADQSIQGFTTTGLVSMLKTGGMATPTSDINGGGLTINGAGTLNLGTGLTHTFSGTWTRTAGTLDCNSSLLRIGANISGTGATFVAGTGTVEYYLAGNQTSVAEVFNNLILSGSGTKTFSTTPTVNGKLTLAGTAAVTVTGAGVVTYGTNATLQYDTTDIRPTTSEEWISLFTASGGIVINGANTITLNAAKVFGLSSPLIITSTGKLAASNNGLTFGGDFINNGGTFTSTGAIVIADISTAQSIAGFTTTGLVSMTKTSGTATFGGNVNGAGLTINGTGGTLNLGSGLTHTFTGAVTLTNGTLNGGSSTLNANFTGTAWTGTGTNFVAGTGTVNFGGVNQILNAASTIFNNLTFSNSGVKTLTSVPTVNGILSMEGAATVTVSPTYGATATLQYNTTTARTSGVEWTTPFTATGGVSVTNTGVITANAIKVFNAAVPLSIAAGATLANGGFSISGGSTLTVANSGTLQLSGTSSFPAFATTTLDVSSTVNYNGTAQTVAAKNYGILLLSGSGNKTFAGATTIAGDLGISGTAVALLLNGTTSSSGTLTFSGGLQAALGSYGGTGSSATNPNGTRFGTTTTGVLNVTTSCIGGTWLGITNTDWNTSTNWCGGSIPTSLTDVTIGFTTNQPVVGSSGGLCRNITIASGATLTISGSNTLTVRGNWTNNGTFVPNTSTVSFNGASTQTIGGSSATTFNNLTNSNITAIVSSAIGITVKNSLNIANAASVLDMATFVLMDGGGSFSNSGSGHIKTANTSGTPIPAGKTWNSVVTYSNATGGQTIVAGTYNGSPALELDNTSGTQTASGNIITGGQLNVINGGTPVFDMNGYNLTTNALNVLAPNSILDMRSGTLTCTSVLSMDGTIRFSGAANGKPFSSGTVEYYGTAQTVTNGNYFKLLFSGATGVYTMASDIDVASTLNITNGAVTLQGGFTLSVGDAITVVNPATLTIENNASLLQTTYTGANTGNVIVKRNTTPVLLYDATFWSSPTTGTQTLYDFSPLTDGDRFNTYDSVIDKYVDENETTTVFEKGKGYSIRCPTGTSSTVPTVLPHQFVGVPNNGTFTIAVTTPPADIGLSLIGNPYSSALNADDFINENLYDALLNPTNTLTGTYYFWSHNTRIIGNDFSSDDYYTCNLSGSTGYTNSGTGNNIAPTGYIASGQGFFVENAIAGNVKFNNSMRETKNNTNFYRTQNTKKVKDLERHRIWLNITNSALTTGSQTMVGYIENATNAYDLGYDSNLFDDTRPLLIYSMLGTDTMAIQGRALPFSDSDSVPIGYFTKVADNVTLSIDHVDGLFLDNQEIYLEDKLLNVIYDIKADPYVFASAAGTFNDRFVLRYTNGSLGTKNFDSQTNKVFVSSKNKQIKINSYSGTIDKVVVFDLLGRQIYQKSKVDSNEFSIANLVSSHQTLVVKTTLQNGITVTDKIMY
ncbi:hypothetical protein SAMN05443549_101722 [Flavobacterium fluvii]|uniref:T9SS sorting signal type C domain-containing protein n=1 Tax=Flavobacterium fluvii TaxID=468056 RepID=A0A1M5FDP3_9FLAO|nr:T9SS sorting signal type C domain-containing protein [Flavobacterium fluvii]SHF89242.1 hypothetical protein SAMN05443549_101722 [Flavobacterium fluvii]